MNATRQDVIDFLARRIVDLDEFDQEDAACIVDVLLEAFTPLQAITWMAFPTAGGDELSTPINMIRDGQARTVLAIVRKMVSDRS